MRIDCQHVWEHISSYIDGEVDPTLRADIDRHLEHCEICSAVMDSTRNKKACHRCRPCFALAHRKSWAAILTPKTP